MRSGIFICIKASNVVMQKTPVQDVLGSSMPCVKLKPWSISHNSYHSLDARRVASSSEIASQTKHRRHEGTQRSVPAPWAKAEVQAGQDLPSISSKALLKKLKMGKDDATSALRGISIVLGTEGKLLRSLERPVLQRILQDPATVAFKLLQLKQCCPLLDLPKLHTINTLPYFVQSEVAVVEVLATVKRCAHHGQMSFQQAQIDINYDGYVIHAVLRNHESGSKKKKQMYEQNLRMVQKKTRNFALKRINTLKTPLVLMCFLQALMDEGRMDLVAEGVAALDKLIAKERRWDLLQ